MKDEWFTDDIRKLDDENIYRRIMSHWIVEMSEMVATANARSIEEIKSFLSRSKDTYKVPYDRFPADRPRQCVFAGTTNRMDFLPMDRTGNRRFLPVQVHPERADIHILSNEAASRAYFDQLWSEIMVQYRSGDFSTHLSKGMEQQLVQEQALFRQEDTLAGQILGFMESYRISSNMAASLVTQTIRDALITEKVTGGLALHSDQGSQYTSTAYFDLSKEYHFRPSMSSPGCPYDNAAMENFFGTLKSECLYRARYSTRAEVEELIAQYIHFYNFERIHLKNGLTPYEIRSKAV